jgi:pilus assembly protein CpaF
MRILNPEGLAKDFESLGMQRKLLEVLLVEIEKPNGMILNTGPTGSGKTTLAADLLSEVPPQERVIALEDTPELNPRHPHFLSLISRPPNSDGFGEVTLRSLLRQTLRMRPDRIILGECRGGEVLDLLQSLNTGHQGSLATLHANSARDALRRIELLCLLQPGSPLPIPTIRELLAGGIQWVAHVKRAGQTRVISEISKVEGREGDTILLRPML